MDVGRDLPTLDLLCMLQPLRELTALLPLLSRKSDRGHLEKYQKEMARWRSDMQGLESPKRSPIAPQYPVSVLDELRSTPDADMAALLYRIAQEAVVNVRKHAQAASVRIEVAEAADGIVVRVIDDGRGFVPDLQSAPEPGHLGISTMVERAELAGGWARVISAPGQGTTVECWLPVDIASGDPDLARLSAAPEPND